MRHVLFFFVLSGTCLAAQPSEDDIKKELKKFHGKWEAIAAVNLDGTSPTDVELQLTTLEIDGDKFTMKTGSLTVNAMFSVDPSKKLKTIDVYFNGNKDNPMRGIYEITGDTRKSCFAPPGKDRPEKFHKEKGFLYLEWKQVK